MCMCLIYAVYLISISFHIFVLYFHILWIYFYIFIIIILKNVQGGGIVEEVSWKWQRRRAILRRHLVGICEASGKYWVSIWEIRFPKKFPGWSKWSQFIKVKPLSNWILHNVFEDQRPRDCYLQQLRRATLQAGSGIPPLAHYQHYQNPYR